MEDTCTECSLRKMLSLFLFLFLLLLASEESTDRSVLLYNVEKSRKEKREKRQNGHLFIERRKFTGRSRSGKNT